MDHPRERPSVHYQRSIWWSRTTSTRCGVWWCC